MDDLGKMLSDDFKKRGEIKADGSIVLKGIVDEIKIGQMKPKTEYTEEEVEKYLNQVYYNLVDILKEWLDLKLEYYPIIALWIIGTYCHKDFYTYPYLFLNATKGSG